jgi:hypothetical protein
VSAGQLAHDFALWARDASLVQLEALVVQLGLVLVERGEPGAKHARALAATLHERIVGERDARGMARSIGSEDCSSSR